MKVKYVPVLFACFVVSSVSAQSTYDECIALTTVQPQQALDLSTQSNLAQSESGMHCQAVALYELQRYEEAGDLFALLHNLLQHKSDGSGFVTSLAAQAARAFANAPNASVKALDWSKTWSQAAPNNVNAWLIQAELYAGENQPASALIPALQAQAVADQIDRPLALATTAGVRIQMGELAAAQDDLYTALELDPKDETTLYVLGQWYWVQGDKETAREVWKQLENGTQDPHWRALANEASAR